jgi:hypothetical protein
MSVGFSYQPPRDERRAAAARGGQRGRGRDRRRTARRLAAARPGRRGRHEASGRTGRGDTGAYVTYGSDDDGTAKHAPSNQYVVKQHEDGELHHPNGGEFKFLEKPMHAAHEAMLGAAAVELKRVFE